jgi:hypothetical protein
LTVFLRAVPETPGNRLRPEAVAAHLRVPQEVVEFERAVNPLLGIIAGIRTGSDEYSV